MARERTRAEQAALTYTCAECGHPATHQAITRKVETFRRLDHGQEKVTQQFADFYLCTPHAESAPFALDPPKAIVLLPHAKTQRANVAAAQRRKARLAYRAAQQPLGDDWGKT